MVGAGEGCVRRRGARSSRRRPMAADVPAPSSWPGAPEHWPAPPARRRARRTSPVRGSASPSIPRRAPTSVPHRAVQRVTSPTPSCTVAGGSTVSQPDGRTGVADVPRGRDERVFHATATRSSASSRTSSSTGASGCAVARTGDSARAARTSARQADDIATPSLARAGRRTKTLDKPAHRGRRLHVCGGASLSCSFCVSPAAAAAPPWPRTEVRAPCTRFDALRAPYFGDLHIHTRFSADAYIFGTRVVPRHVYDFVRGTAARSRSRTTTRIRRGRRAASTARSTSPRSPITAEFYRRGRSVLDPGSLVYDRDAVHPPAPPEPDLSNRFEATVNWLFPPGSRTRRARISSATCRASTATALRSRCGRRSRPRRRRPTTAPPPARSRASSATSTPRARSAATSIATSSSATTHVPPFAASHLETVDGGIPQGIWSAIETRVPRTPAPAATPLIIPHNSEPERRPAVQRSGRRGRGAAPPGARAAGRDHQQQGQLGVPLRPRSPGSAPARPTSSAPSSSSRGAHQGPGRGPPPIERLPAAQPGPQRLKDGLAPRGAARRQPVPVRLRRQHRQPQRHRAARVDESGWEGASGNVDATPARQIAESYRDNPGGLAVAGRRRTRATRSSPRSGGARPTPPAARGRWSGSSPATCAASAAVATRFVRDAYASGTPMGGELGAVRGDGQPALRGVGDEGSRNGGAAGVDLQRIQIVKGWVDAAGHDPRAGLRRRRRRRERRRRRSRDLRADAARAAPSCAPCGEIRPSSRDERAFYYARVLENPTCRWTTRVCKAAGVDPLSRGLRRAGRRAPAATSPTAAAGASNDATAEPVIQERAWTSPIWSTGPQGIARVQASPGLRTRGASATSLTLRIWLAAPRRQLDLARDDLVVRVTDGDRPAGRHRPG